MNLKNSRSMNKIIRITAAVCLLLSSLFTSYAQEYEDVESRNLWLSGNNIAGLTTDSLSICQAVLGGKFEAGENRQSYEAPLCWSAGAHSSGIVHLKEFSMTGHFGFEQFTGYDMCGSMFITPGFYPVDQVEYTPGRKTKQVYDLGGGISVPLENNFSLGAMMDVKAINYTKVKDLRYSDFALNLSLKPSILWQCGALRIGASFILDRDTEMIDADQVAAAQTSYHAFINKGLYYGIDQIWSSDAIHLDEAGITGFPLQRNALGFALQAEWKGFYCEGSYRHSAGKIGEKDAMWYKFPGDEASLTLAYKLMGGNGAEHRMVIDADFMRDRLDEAVIEKVSSGGVTTRKILGYNSIYNRSSMSITASWDMLKMGAYEFMAYGNYSREDGVSSLVYPMAAQQSLNSYDFGGKALYWLGSWRLGVNLSLSGGKLFENVSSVAGETVNHMPYRQQEYYEMWRDYNTALHFSSEISIRYKFAKGLYLELVGDSRVRKSHGRYAVSFNFGCTF